jgi:hypothetical protein
MAATVNTVATTPGAVLTTLYTCPTGKRAAVRYLQATNIAGAAKTFRLAISPDGAAIVDAHYLAYGTSLPANEYTAWSGLVLGAGDVVRVYGEDANVQFWLSVYEDDA